jgi:predicted Ser/Thr protein kinase
VDGGAAMNAPERVGRYEIVRRIGKSMTDVYLATDIVERRKVALKLVRTAGEGVDRLILEAERRGAAIQKELQGIDPRMVQVYDYGDQDGYFYVAMQYVEGRNLAEVLRAEQRIDPDRAATIALELCEQLGKFHSAQAGVVHGDVKPSNIHLGQHDTVRLLDFGIAKTLRADCDATGHNFGSPGYCSPERLARSEVDQQSDLWAVGATLYEMLGGAPPYQAENTRKLEAVIRSKRPPRALPAAVPRAVRLIVSKSLAPNRAHRYGSARAFEADLQAFLEHRPTAAERERRASGTVEAVLRKATQTIANARRRLQVLSAVGWFSAGMMLWIGGSYGWQVLEARPIIEPPNAPAPPRNFSLLYRAEGERVLHTTPVDWARAEVLLERAVQLGNTDAHTLSELALAHTHGAPPPPPRVAATAPVLPVVHKLSKPALRRPRATRKPAPRRYRRWR